MQPLVFSSQISVLSSTKHYKKLLDGKILNSKCEKDVLPNLSRLFLNRFSWNKKPKKADDIYDVMRYCKVYYNISVNVQGYSKIHRTFYILPYNSARYFSIGMKQSSSCSYWYWWQLLHLPILCTGCPICYRGEFSIFAFYFISQLFLNRLLWNKRHLEVLKKLHKPYKVI